jgi:hypothetical protein
MASDSPDRLEAAALDFACLCLLQPDSRVAAPYRIEVLPDGYNSGPEAFADMSAIHCDDIHNVITIVTYWCSLNEVSLEITYKGQGFQCRFLEGEPLNQMIETNGSTDLCHELLAGAALLATRMKNINAPRPSMKRADFQKP